MTSNEKSSFIGVMRQEIAELHAQIACLNEELMLSAKRVKDRQDEQRAFDSFRNARTADAKILKDSRDSWLFELQNMVQGFGFALVFFDKKKKLKYFNSAAATMFGITNSDLGLISDELWFFSELSLDELFHRSLVSRSPCVSYGQGIGQKNIQIDAVRYYSQANQEWGVLFCMKHVSDGDQA